jgi:hypothetical protein
MKNCISGVFRSCLWLKDRLAFAPHETSFGDSGISGHWRRTWCRYPLDDGGQAVAVDCRRAGLRRHVLQDWVSDALMSCRGRECLQLAAREHGMDRRTYCDSTGSLAIHVLPRNRQRKGASDWLRARAFDGENSPHSTGLRSARNRKKCRCRYRPEVPWQPKQNLCCWNLRLGTAAVLFMESFKIYEARIRA